MSVVFNSKRDLSNSEVSLSPALRSFYESHNVVKVLEESSVRFIRLNPRFSDKETLSLLPKNSKKVLWLDDQFGFYSVDGDLQLNQSESFRSGRVYGMDVSSGAAVAVLLSTIYNKRSSVIRQTENNSDDPIKGKRVLDLCCAPGLKLCMIADLLDESSLVVGVDVSSTRLSSCKSIVKKYHIDTDTSGDDSQKRCAAPIRLYCADGLTFGTANTSSAELIFDSKVAKDEAKASGKRKRMNKSARARERKRLKTIIAEEAEPFPNNDDKMKPAIEPFDYVLVDAECSTDGSLKHLQQQIKRKAAVADMKVNGKEKGNHITTIDNQQLTNETDLRKLVHLQKRLIESGYFLLKKGGVLVYSTCSLSESQNESVVSSLLEKNEDAYLIPIEFSSTNEDFILSGSIPGTVRFVPTDFSKGVGGFFVAKIGKRKG